MKDREALIDPTVKTDILGRQPTTAMERLACCPLPSPELRLAASDLFLDCTEQKLLPRDMRMPVEVAAKTL
jgi:hypothetical protein